MRLFFCVLTLATASFAFAQGTPTWALRVAYEMDIHLTPENHQFTGEQRLVVYNTTPDTLRYVYYHLYFNAFNPRSMMAQRNRDLPDPDARVVPRIHDLTPAEEGFHRVQTLTQDGSALTFRVHDTLLRTDLLRPLAPGDSTVLEMTFHSQIPLQTRRSGRDSREGIDYSMAQWYPKLAHYDSRGWHADPYVGREFYAPFGTFNVRLNLPAEYVVGATGTLQNPNEIGHGYTDTQVTHAPGSRLNWHFYAENVHDFAWAADRDYIHDRIQAGPYTFHLLYQPNVAQGWEGLRRLVPATFAYLNQRVGPYPYPQFTVAQGADGGMEYPMLTLITGGRTFGSLVGVTVHEAAHMWFYGVMGTNENDHHWIDEGFTDFLTNATIAELFNQNTNHRGATQSIVALQESGLFERINQPADWYDTNRAYGQAAYAGGHMVLELLGYVMGDAVRDRFLQETFRQYVYRHPQPADLERVAEEVAGFELDWFFEQVLNTTWRLDYAVDGIRRDAGQSHIALRRVDRMFFPIDLRLTYADGRTQDVTIPTSEMMGAKSVPESWLVAAPWPWTHTAYTLSVPGEVVHVQLDPERRLPDYNRLNDASQLPVEWRFGTPPRAVAEAYSLGYRPTAWYASTFGAGIGVRAQGRYWLNRWNSEAELQVWERPLRTRALSEDDVPLSRPGLSRPSWIDAVDYHVRLESSLPAISPRTRYAVSASKRLGVVENRAEVRHTRGRFAALGQNRGVISAYAVHQGQPTQRALALDGFPVLAGDHVAFAGLGFEAGRGLTQLTVRAEVGGSLRPSVRAPQSSVPPALALSIPTRATAARLTLDARYGRSFGKMEATSRLFVGLAPRNLAWHRQFRAGAQSFEDLWRSDASRSAFALLPAVNPSFNVQAFSGVGPVGYALAHEGTQGCGAPFVNCAIPRYGLQPPGSTPMSTSIMAGSVRVKVPSVPLFGVRHLALEAFSGGAMLWGQTSVRDEVRPATEALFIADAGLSVSLRLTDIPALRRFSALTPALRETRISVHAPLWLSHPEFVGRSAQTGFAYLVGLTSPL